MIHLIKLEMKKNIILYVLLLFIVVFSAFLFMLNEYYYKSNLDFFPDILFIILLPINIYFAFMNEKWGLFLTLGKRKTQLFVKVLMAIVSTLIYSFILLSFYCFIDDSVYEHTKRVLFSDFTTINEYVSYLNTLIILPGLFITLLVIYHLYFTSCPQKVRSLIFLISLLFCIVMIFISIDLLKFHFMVVLNLIIYIMIRYYYLRIEV